MSKQERGTKRKCQECEVKFYDLNRDPIICPSCGATFIIPEDNPSQEVEGGEKEEIKVEAEVVIDADAPEIISLDEVEDEENVVEDIPDLEDVEVDSEISVDDEDAFLEVDDDDAKIDLVVPTDTRDE